MGGDSSGLPRSGRVGLVVPPDNPAAGAAKVAAVQMVAHKATIAIGGRNSLLTVFCISNLLFEKIAARLPVRSRWDLLGSVVMQFVCAAKKTGTTDLYARQRRWKTLGAGPSPDTVRGLVSAVCPHRPM